MLNVFCYGAFISVVIFLIKCYGKGIRQRAFAWISNGSIEFVNKSIRERKRKLFSSLGNHQQRGNIHILELGAGGGANFEFFPTNSEVTCLEPNVYFKGYIEANTPRGIHVKSVVRGFGEDMRKAGIDDNSFDAVVCTLVLCSVRDVDKVLSEVKRVLKTNGKFYFLEHIKADDGTVLQTIQRCLNPVWRGIYDGCHLTRDTPAYIRRAGFQEVQLQKFVFPSILMYVEGPFCCGIATK